MVTAELLAPQRIEIGQHLPIQVRQLETIEVGNAQMADAGAHQTLHADSAHAAEPAHEHARVPERLLLCRIDEAEVAAYELRIVEHSLTSRAGRPGALAHERSRLGCGFEPMDSTLGSTRPLKSRSARRARDLTRVNMLHTPICRKSSPRA